MAEKSFAFLIDCPTEGKFMMFPDYYENIAEHLKEQYTQVEVDLSNLRWSAELKNIKYKVFKLKSTEDGKN